MPRSTTCAEAISAAICVIHTDRSSQEPNEVGYGRCAQPQTPRGIAMQEVEFFLGLGSRYSYLAFTQIARIETSYSCTFNLQPTGSRELLNLCGASPFQGAPLSGQYEFDYRRRDAVAWAEYYRVPFVEPKPLPKDHRLTARACHAPGMRAGCDLIARRCFRRSTSATRI